jgi:hypothetical protein
VKLVHLVSFVKKHVTVFIPLIKVGLTMNETKPKSKTSQLKRCKCFIPGFGKLYRVFWEPLVANRRIDAKE